MPAAGPYHQRDERGWRVPRPGTLSFLIYEMLMQGMKVGEIHDRLPFPGLDYGTVSQLIYKIRNPGLSNANNMVYRRRRRERREMRA